MAALQYRMLGGLEVTSQTGRLDLGTRKQRALLAVLLLAEGRALSTDRLIDEIWGAAAPDRADASLQSYVSTLRRTLEPDRAPRTPAQILVTRGTSYALLASRHQVDVGRFTDLIEQGRTEQAAGQLRESATTLRSALDLYAPLLPEFEAEPFHTAAAQHLERKQLAALELSYEVRLALGEHHALLADLESVVQRHRLHEGLWALLAVARYRSGRQSGALEAIAQARRLLADEIGVDPGPRLRQLEADLLAQAPHLDPPQVPATPIAVRAPATGVTSTADEPATQGEPVAGQPAGGVPVIGEPAVSGENRSGREVLVGRFDELSVLHRATLDVIDGRDALILVEGEPGAGKTRLLEEAAAQAVSQGGLRVTWGRCTEGDGSPSMWPWVQILSDALDVLEPADRDRLLDTELGRLVTERGEVTGVPDLVPDSGARFRLFDQAGRLMDGIAQSGPLVVVIDDLQWADSSSLELFVHLAARRPRRVLLIAALRDRSAGRSEELNRALAELSRLPSHRRIHCGPLAKDAVAELIRQQTGQWPSPEVVRRVRDRTEGNPFFVRELSRLLHDAGGLDAQAMAEAGVPSGVRDVVRGRVEGVGPGGRDLLQLAALIGRDVDLLILARAGDLDVEECLNRLEPAEELGLLTQNPQDPFTFRFAHDLVRESIIETTPPMRLVRLHLKIADALDGGAPGSEMAERLAHHLWSAGPLATPARTAAALLAAAKQAIRRYSYGPAERQLTSAATLARQAGDAELELDAVALLTSVVGVQQGYVGATLELMERAENLAETLGQQRRAGDFLYSRWAAYSQRIELGMSSQLALQLRELGRASEDPVVKMYGDHAWGIDQWDHGNIGESYRSLQRSDEFVQSQLRNPGPASAIDVLRYDLQLLSPAFMAYMTAMHGDVAQARRRFEEALREAGTAPYPQVVLTSFASTTGAHTGDPAWAVHYGQHYLSVDPEFTFVFLGTFTRIGYWWGRTLLGDTDEGADRIRALLDGISSDSPRSGEAAWLSLLADAYLTEGRFGEADAALDDATRSMQRHGQLYPEPLRRLIRAKWLHATGASEQEIRSALGAVREEATAREAFLYVQRADQLERDLFGT